MIDLIIEHPKTTIAIVVCVGVALVIFSNWNKKEYDAESDLFL